METHGCATGVILETINKDGRYYWIKLNTSFFDSEDVRVIEAQNNGEKYIVFWLKLLLLAVKQDEIGILRYKENIPYTPELLATITKTDIDTVRSSLTLFQKLGLLQTAQKGEIWIEAVHSMVGSITEGAIRMRRFRERIKKEIEDKTSHPEQSDVDIEIETEEEIEIDKEKESSPNSETSASAEDTKVSLNIFFKNLSEEQREAILKLPKNKREKVINAMLKENQDV